jgi:hypothetical protein
MTEREKFFPNQLAIIRSTNPNNAPMRGAKNINIIVFIHPDVITAAIHPLATAAPRYPPRSACEELVGRAIHQVIRFHVIAPNNPEKITRGVTKCLSIMPLPIVFATAVPTMNMAIKLKKAAQITAYFGESTRVATTVAIELALSCIPLV